MFHLSVVAEDSRLLVLPYQRVFLCCWTKFRIVNGVVGEQNLDEHKLKAQELRLKTG